MMPWRYASRQPPIPAMNEAIAKLTTFTQTTLTPMPAAERSLARTASIAEPNALVRSRAHEPGDDDQHDEAHEPELQPGERLRRAPMPRSQPNSFGGSTRVAGRRRRIWLLRNQIASMRVRNARVTTPSVSPRSRSAGKPTTTPTHGGDQRGQQRCERERHAPARR